MRAVSSLLLVLGLPLLLSSVAPGADGGAGQGASSEPFLGYDLPAIDPYESDIPGLDPLATETLRNALFRMGVREEELGFDKQWAEDDTFRLAVVEDLLDDPLALPGFQSNLVKSVRERRGQPLGLYGQLVRLLAVDPWAVRVREPKEILPTHFLEELATAAAGDGIRRVANDLESARGDDSWYGEIAGRSVQTFDPDREVDAILRWLGAGQDDLDHALAKVESRLRTHVLMSAAATWGGEDDPVDRSRKGELHREFGAPVDTTGDIESDWILDAATAVRRDELLSAGGALLRASMDTAQLTSRLLRNRSMRRPGPNSAAPIDPDFAPLQAKIQGSILGAWRSQWGWVVIGGAEDNVYPADVLDEIVVLGEAGGNDIYRGRVASAVGQLHRSFSIVVDLQGDDVYDSGGKSYAVGGAVFGCAALIDLGGNDTYTGATGSLGAGYFGVAALYDGGGNDQFHGTTFTEGAGAFGVGMLVSMAGGPVPERKEIERDLGYDQGLLSVPRTGSLPVRYDDNDVYTAELSAQGFGSTHGVGLLYDEAGNDIYRAGGRYLHEPLLPNDFQSLSQGFGIGFRPRAAGGVGLLLDEQGNDFYDAEVFAQGTGYWYSLGLLFDGAGNDRYLATQYAQGAGVHLALGSLWDRGGDDHYVSKNGVVQGTAHDLSVGLLRDESGDDVYAVSGGQGVSLSNSFALFLDEMGDDLYATFEGSRGYARFGRGFSGAAVFLDLEGNDHYPGETDAANGREWRTSHYTLGVDLDRDVTLPTEDLPEIVLTAEDSTRAIDELFETASLWEVGSAREKVRRARMALVARGMPAVEYAVGASGPYEDGEPLLTDQGLVYRTLQELANAYPDSFGVRLLPRLADPKEQVKKNAIALLGDMKWKPARERLEALLADPDAKKHYNRTIQALGKIRDPEAAPSIRPFLADSLERRRILSLEALKFLGDDASAPAFVGRLSDPYFTVRSAAMSGLAAFREASVDPLLDALTGSPDGLRLGMSNDGESVESGLEAESSFDRVHAVITLGLIVGAVKDSTSESAVEMRTRVNDALFAELERACASLRESEALEGAEPGAEPSVDSAALASAALEGLLRSQADGVEARAEGVIAGIEAPLVLRTWERRR
ncbi:MAG: HEAT repeat domain-containing protein [Candidatus Eisenbacteria bacterium]